MERTRYQLCWKCDCVFYQHTLAAAVCVCVLLYRIDSSKKSKQNNEEATWVQKSFIRIYCIFISSLYLSLSSRAVGLFTLILFLPLKPDSKMSSNRQFSRFTRGALKIHYKALAVCIYPAEWAKFLNWTKKPVLMDIECDREMRNYTW